MINFYDKENNFIEPLAAKNDNGFVINLDGAMGSMSQDETKLRQCLTNFLSNGFKFTKNGTVTLDVKSRMNGDVEFIDFAVIDTGAGMSPEGVAKVFEEYTQAERSTSANYGGTGLGLPISKKFAEMMGGDVVVTSEEGVGSTFTMSVPRECPEYSEDEGDANRKGRVEEGSRVERGRAKEKRTKRRSGERRDGKKGKERGDTEPQEENQDRQEGPIRDPARGLVLMQAAATGGLVKIALSGTRGVTGALSVMRRGRLPADSLQPGAVTNSGFFQHFYGSGCSWSLPVR